MAAISTLSGNFNDAAVWTLATGFTASLDNSRMDEKGSASISFVVTVTGYDLTGSNLTWKNQWIPPPSTTASPSPANQLSIEFRNGGTASTGYRLIRNTAGVWQFYTLTGGLTAVGSTFTDVFVRANPFMRLRESGGTTFFETSVTGSSWAEPDGTQHVANFATITNITLRFSPTAVADSGLWSVQQINGTSAPALANDPTIFFMQSTSTAATDGLNTSPTAPTVSTGDLSLLVIQGKGASAGVAPTSTTPSGWTIIGAITNNGTLVSGTDTGSNSIVMYQRQDSGYGNPTISTTGFNSMNAAIFVFRSSKVASGGTWNVTSSTTGSDTASGANISITGGASIAVSAGDAVFAVAGASGDLGTATAMAIGGMSGATLYYPNTPLNRDVSFGADSRMVASYDYVTAGSSTSAPTYTYTNASSTTAHGMFLRIRDVAGVTTARFQSVNSYNPARIRAANW